MDYHSLSRKQLQSLCKNHGIPANMTNVAMADALKSLNLPEGSVTGIQPTDAVILQDSGMNSPVSSLVSCRRTPLRTCTRSMTRTTRSRREPEREEEEEPKSSIRGVSDSLSEVKGSPEQVRTPRTVARSGRRINARVSARRQIEKVEIGGDLSAHVKLDLPPVVLPENETVVASSAQASRRRLTRSSARCQIEQKEIKPERMKNENQNPPTSSSIYNTRRSARLRANNPDSENKPSAIENLEKKLTDESETNVTQKSDQELTGKISNGSSIAIGDSDSTTGPFQEIIVHMPEEIPSSVGLFSSSEKCEVEQPSCKTGDAIFVQEICIGEEGNGGKVEGCNIVADNSLLSVEISLENITIHENTDGCLFHTESPQKKNSTNEISCLDPKTSPVEAGSEVIPANDNTASVEANSNGEEAYDAAGSNEDTAPLDPDSNLDEAYNPQFPLPLEAREDSASVKVNSNGEAYDAAGGEDTDSLKYADSIGKEAHSPPLPHPLEVLGEIHASHGASVAVKPEIANVTFALFSIKASNEAKAVPQPFQPLENLEEQELLQHEAHDSRNECCFIAKAPLGPDSNGNEQFPLPLEARENTASVKANSNEETYDAAGGEDIVFLKDADSNGKEAQNPRLPLPLEVLEEIHASHGTSVAVKPEIANVTFALFSIEASNEAKVVLQPFQPLEPLENLEEQELLQNEAHDSRNECCFTGTEGRTNYPGIADSESEIKPLPSAEESFNIPLIAESIPLLGIVIEDGSLTSEIADNNNSEVGDLSEAMKVVPNEASGEVQQIEVPATPSPPSLRAWCAIPSLDYSQQVSPLANSSIVKKLGKSIGNASGTKVAASSGRKVLPNEASGEVPLIEEPATPSPPSLRAWCALPSLDYSQQVSPLANSSIVKKSGKSIGNASGTKVAASSGRKVHMSIEALTDKENNVSGMKSAASSAKKVLMSTEPLVEKENVSTHEKDIVENQLTDLSLRKLRTMVKEKEKEASKNKENNVSGMKSAASSAKKVLMSSEPLVEKENVSTHEKDIIVNQLTDLSLRKLRTMVKEKEKEASKNNVQVTARAPLGTLPGNRLLNDENLEMA